MVRVRHPPACLRTQAKAAVLAVGGATAATHLGGLDVALIGELPSGLQAFQFAVPSLPPVEAYFGLTRTTLLIYLMTSVESLLSCVALEKMKKTSYKHNPDQELVVSLLCHFVCDFVLFVGN